MAASLVKRYSPGSRRFDFIQETSCETTQRRVSRRPWSLSRSTWTLRLSAGGAPKKAAISPRRLGWFSFTACTKSAPLPVIASAMVGLQAMASMVTSAPSSAPAAASRPRSVGIAFCSQDLSATASWPSTRRSLVAKAETRWSACLPVPQSWLRREVLPLILSLSKDDGDQLGRVRPSLVHPTHETGREHLRIHAVHQRAQPLRAGDAVKIGQEAAQEGEMGLAPIHDVVVTIAGRDCAAHHQEQHFRQGISHPPLLAGVSHCREMVQQATQTRLLAECLHLPGLPSIRAPEES